MDSLKPETPKSSNDEQHVSNAPAQLTVNKLRQEWTVDVKSRGASGKKDKYYVERSTGLEFFSKKDAERYMNDGHTQNCKKQPRKRSKEEVDALVETSQMASRSKNTAEGSSFELRIIPERGLQPENRPKPEPEGEVAMQEPPVPSGFELPVDALLVGQDGSLTIPYDVTSYPIWNNLREIEDEFYWAGYANPDENLSGAASEAPRKTPSKDQTPPTEHGSGSSSPKQ